MKSHLNGSKKGRDSRQGHRALLMLTLLVGEGGGAGRVRGGGRAYMHAHMAAWIPKYAAASVPL